MGAAAATPRPRPRGLAGAHAAVYALARRRSIAFIVSDTTARRDMKSVLAKLEKVTAEEAAAKRAALQAVRDAFVFRPPEQGPNARPSAVDLLGELCDASRFTRSNQTSRQPAISWRAVLDACSR